MEVGLGKMVASYVLVGTWYHCEAAPHDELACLEAPGTLVTRRFSFPPGRTRNGGKSVSRRWSLLSKSKYICPSAHILSPRNIAVIFCFSPSQKNRFLFGDKAFL
jgi:hypothetical protein